MAGALKVAERMSQGSIVFLVFYRVYKDLFNFMERYPMNDMYEH